MEKYYILYNSIAKNGQGKIEAECLDVFYNTGESILLDITTINDYKEFFSSIDEKDNIIICGGDGTINKFINSTIDVLYKNKIFYYPAGSGNDFYRDMTNQSCGGIIEITQQLKNLPTAMVKGNEYKFINGVGYGIDGYCCEVGDKKRAIKKKKINYTTIAIGGLLFHYKPTNARVIVDGKEYNYKKVWLAPTMYGRCYGGGMMPAPKQKRGKEILSVMIFHETGKFKTLTIFPSIFKGEHIRHTKHVEVISGKNIKVIYEEPRPLQIDGETIIDVLEYTAKI